MKKYICTQTSQYAVAARFLYINQTDVGGCCTHCTLKIYAKFQSIKPLFSWGGQSVNLMLMIPISIYTIAKPNKLRNIYTPIYIHEDG